MQLILMMGFLLALGVGLYFTDSIIKLKNFEIASNNVISSMRQMNYQTGSLMTNRAPVIQTSVHWTNSISQFEKELSGLQDYSELHILNSAQARQLAEATGWWNQIYEWYYRPAIKQLQKMVVSEAGRTAGSNGLLQTLIELQNQQGPPPDFIGEFLTMQNYQNLIVQETKTFSDRMNALTKSIRNQVEENVRTSIRLVVLLLLLTLSSTIIITARFSSLIARRIRQVEIAIRNMAGGDFSTELHIRSKDELEELSRNYNTLKNQLQEKLNSVLGFMFSISSTLPEDPDIDSILEIIAQSARKTTGADGAAVYLFNEEDQLLHPRAINGEFLPPFPVPGENATDQQAIVQYTIDHPFPAGSYVVGRAVRDAEPVFIRNPEKIREETRCDLTGENFLCINSLIVCPLMISTRILGAVVVTHQKPKGQFTDLEYTHLQTFADYAALTIDNTFNYQELIEKKELHREIEIAANIQKNLLPGRLPRFHGAGIAAFSKAARGISGDYYDAFLIDRKRVGILICDVVGKGVPASLLMVMIRTIIRLVISPNRTPAQLLTLLNRGITGRIGTDHFATMGIFFYEREKKKITYSNAGHPPILVYRPGKDTFFEVDTPGLPIGIEQKEKYVNKSFNVDSGDILVLFTDGIPETRSPSGTEYGNESLKKVLRRSHPEKNSAKQILGIIERDLRDFTGTAEQHDDQTMIIMKITG